MFLKVVEIYVGCVLIFTNIIQIQNKRPQRKKSVLMTLIFYQGIYLYWKETSKNNVNRKNLLLILIYLAIVYFFCLYRSFVLDFQFFLSTTQQVVV